MSYVAAVAALLLLSIDRAASQVPPPSPCPATTQAENTALARAWHEDVINRRNRDALEQILAPGVVLHAAEGYPKTLDGAGIGAMVADFLSAFPDLVYAFDQFIAAMTSSSSVIPQPERSGASLATYRHQVAWRPGLASTFFASNADELLKFGRRPMQFPAPSS